MSATAGSAPSLRRRALEDGLDSEFVDRLIAARETLFVERKAAIPSDGLGPTVASFGNTLGGWLLLGVSDDGTIAGYSPPGRAELQDHLRHVLGSEVDPLPPFAAAQVTHGDKPIGVVKIAESADTPHVTSSGVVYIREPGGKRPITDYRTLIELARRGEAARQSAEARPGQTAPREGGAFAG